MLRYRNFGSRMSRSLYLIHEHRMNVIWLDGSRYEGGHLQLSALKRLGATPRSKGLVKFPVAHDR